MKAKSCVSHQSVRALRPGVDGRLGADDKLRCRGGVVRVFIVGVAELRR